MVVSTATEIEVLRMMRRSLRILLVIAGVGAVGVVWHARELNIYSKKIDDVDDKLAVISEDDLEVKPKDVLKALEEVNKGILPEAKRRADKADSDRDLMRQELQSLRGTVESIKKCCDTKAPGATTQQPDPAGQ